MKAFQPDRFVVNSEQLIRLFGYWPEFHDAEVIELNLWRGDLRPAEQIYIFPKLTIKIHVWELTDKYNDDGFLKRQKHTVVVLQFQNIQDLTIKDFNHHNSIEHLKLSVATTEATKDSTSEKALIFVEFVQSHGISAKFSCFGIEVVSAVSCDEHGNA